MCKNKIKIETVEGDVYTGKSPEENVQSIINNIIEDIVSTSVNIDRLDRTFPSEITKKINYNHLRKKRRIILEYKSYSSQIEKAYKIADERVVNGKQTAMGMLNRMYFEALDKFDIDLFDIDMDKIRENADDIVDNIIKQLRKFVYKSSNVSVYKEQVEIGINVVVAHAFVECLVLENPNATS